MTVDQGGKSKSVRGGASRANPAAAMFNVPAEVRHLDKERLELLADSIRTWRDKAAKFNVKRSRTRIWLIFLLLRHTGGRLKEILELDPDRDFQPGRGVVRLGAGQEPDKAREVEIPEEVLREVLVFMNDPRNTGGGGPPLDMDLGYVRRKLYERAEAAGLPRSLAGPSVIRNSRAVEMLRAGTPLAVVQHVLGLESIGPAARFLEFSSRDIERMTHIYARREMSKKTSARNIFSGEVVEVDKGPVMSEVMLAVPAGGSVSAIITNESLYNLGIELGTSVTATIKAPFVNLVKRGGPGRITARNRFPGRVKEIQEDSTVAEIVVAVEGGTELCVLASSRGVRDMDLAVGDEVEAFFKALSVVLQVD